MNRTVAGLPLWMWGVGAAAFGAAIWWIKRGQSKSGQPSTSKAAAPAFSQQQEIQDFQIYSQLTSAQQASDLSFVSTMLGLFEGGSSNAATTTGAGTATGSNSTPTTTTSPTTTTTPTTTSPTYVTPPASVGPSVAISPGTTGTPAPTPTTPSPATTTPTTTVIYTTGLTSFAKAAGRTRQTAVAISAAETPATKGNRNRATKVAVSAAETPATRP